jgi:phage replication-related protein YjqB (UPF0714/DUF867 family)
MERPRTVREQAQIEFGCRPMSVTIRVSPNFFRCYDELAQRYLEGVDCAVHVMARERSRVAVLAPHGGRIEGRTSEIARATISTVCTLPAIGVAAERQ